MKVIENNCLSQQNKLKVYLSLKDLIQKKRNKEKWKKNTFQYNEISFIHDFTPFSDEKYPNNNAEYIMIIDGDISYFLHYRSIDGRKEVSLGTTVYSDNYENIKKQQGHFCLKRSTLKF